MSPTTRGSWPWPWGLSTVLVLTVESSPSVLSINSRRCTSRLIPFKNFARRACLRPTRHATVLVRSRVLSHVARAEHRWRVGRAPPIAHLLARLPADLEERTTFGPGVDDCAS